MHRKDSEVFVNLLKVCLSVTGRVFTLAGGSPMNVHPICIILFALNALSTRTDQKLRALHLKKWIAMLITTETKLNT